MEVATISPIPFELVGGEDLDREKVVTLEQQELFEVDVRGL